ncbi:MAG TPA: tetratricopeptide repeat protein [Clostridiales bacterium]|nr:tetratricopeptide repeat protein [Clostridiales bacterium]
MIELKNELKNFTPINLENITKINPEISEDLKNSIMLYNSALANLATNSEDIAIIELKKAVAVNPDFYEAVNLLGLCFYYMKAYEKAEEMFERVARAENNGIKAASYLEIIRNKDTLEDLQHEKQPPKGRTRKKVSKIASGTVPGTGYRTRTGGRSEVGLKPSNTPVTTDRATSSATSSTTSSTTLDASNLTIANTTVSRRKTVSGPASLPEFPLIGRRKTGSRDGAIKYLTGIIIGLIIAFIVGVPSIFKPQAGKEANKKDDNIASLEALVKEYEVKYNQLSDKNETLKKELETVKLDADYYKSAIKLYEAEELLKVRKYEEAADILVVVKNAGFNSSEKDKYERLSKEIMPRAADLVYSQAYNLFQAGKYRESLEKYSKIPDYMENYGKLDIVLYYMGKCYLEIGDKENAKKEFDNVISKFPESEYAKYSKSRLDSIGNTQ